MTLLARAKSVVSSALHAALEKLSAMPPRDELAADVAALNERLAEYERCIRMNKVYYGLVQGLCKERDQWKEMFQTQSVENAAAQAFMNEQLEKAQTIIASVMGLMNAERRAQNKPEMRLEHRLDTGAVIKKRFDELLADLNASAPAGIDGPKERDRIAEGKLCLDRELGAVCGLPEGHKGDHRTLDALAAWAPRRKGDGA